MKSIYPFVSTEEGLLEAYREVQRLREREDLPEFANLSNIFIKGRKVDKVPTGSSDVAATDSLGDINWDASYIYILIDNAGTPAWRRVALSSW